MENFHRNLNSVKTPQNGPGYNCFSDFSLVGRLRVPLSMKCAASPHPGLTANQLFLTPPVTVLRPAPTCTPRGQLPRRAPAEPAGSAGHWAEGPACVWGGSMSGAGVGGQGRWKVPERVSGGQCQELGLNLQPIGNSFLGRGSLPPPGSLFPLSRHEKKLPSPVPGAQQGVTPPPLPAVSPGPSWAFPAGPAPSPFLTESCFGEGCDAPPQS